MINTLREERDAYQQPNNRYVLQLYQNLNICAVYISHILLIVYRTRLIFIEAALINFGSFIDSNR